MKRCGFCLILILILLSAALPSAGLSVIAASSERTVSFEETAVPAADAPSSAFTDHGIPVVSLTVDPEQFQAVLDSPDHSVSAEGASLRIDVPAGYRCEYGEPEPSALSCELPLEYLRGRGNSTWVFPEKKPFKLKLETAQDLLSMGANKHWVLLAGAMDDTLLHNRIAARLGEALGLAYMPIFVPVDLVVNGEYFGSYLLGHQVRIGENRVDIDKIGKADTELPMISGGYLLGLEPDEGEPEINVITTKRGVRFLLDTPDLSEYTQNEEGARAAQRSYIESYLQQVEDAVFAAAPAEGGASWTELLDARSAAKCWWVQEFSFNADGMMTPSAYLYKPRNDKLYFGPLWDFDRAFYDSWNLLDHCRMAWLDQLRAYDPEYQAVLKEVWAELSVILQELTADGGTIDRYAEEIRASWEADLERWPENHKAGSDFDALILELKQAIDARRQNIEAVLDARLTRVFADVSFEDGGRVLSKQTVRIGDRLSGDCFPAPPEKEGRRFLFWLDEQGALFLPGHTVYGDLKLHAEYEKEAETPAASEPSGPEKTEEGPSSGIPVIVLPAVLVLAGVSCFLIFRSKRR